MRLAAFSAGLLLLLTGPAAATYFDTGNELYERCLAALPSPRLTCMASASAFMDMMETLGYTCPSGLTKGQVTDVLLKYLKDHPESRHKSAASLALEAYSTAFGCKSG
jgi:hypothetical protein